MVETHGELRERFTIAKARWVLSVCAIPGFRLRENEVARSNEQAEINAMGKGGRARLAELCRHHFPLFARSLDDNTGNGIRNSLHELGLAADFNLFVSGAFISDGDSEHWVRIGLMWEQAGQDHCWGGRFSDANHISIAYQGRK